MKQYPNVFHNGVEYVDISPIFPLERNILNKILHSVKKQSDKKDDLFKYISYNLINSLLAYSIVDNEKEIFEKILTNSYADINITIYSHNRSVELGKPLDIAIKSIISNEDIDMAMHLIKRGAFSANNEKAIEILAQKEKAAYEFNRNMAFRLSILKNYLKVINNDYNAEYVDKTVVLNQMVLSDKKLQAENIKYEEAKSILRNVYKLSETTIEKVNQNLESHQEKKFIEEKLKSLNVSNDLMTTVNKNNNFNLLHVNDPTIIDYPRKSIAINLSLSKEKWDDFFNLVSENFNIKNIQYFNFSKTLERFLIYQSLEDLKYFDKSFKENIDSNFDDKAMKSLKMELELTENNIATKNDLQNLKKERVYLLNEEIANLKTKHFQDLNAEDLIRIEKEQLEQTQAQETQNLDQEAISNKIDEKIKKKSIFARIFG